LFRDSLSDAEVDDKFMELAAPVIGEARAKDELSRLRRLESGSMAA
jgi:hypothetical protein